MLTWTDEDRFAVGDTSFELLPERGSFRGRASRSLRADFLIAKPRPMVERYVSLIDELRPQHIFELGIFQGGSTALLAQLARPRRLVAVDRRSLEGQAIRRWADERRDHVWVYGDVDQADRRKLQEIIEQAFEGVELDLVVDDCSHHYEPTRASFNELFPRLRAGGVYVIEDWPWAHPPVGAEQEEELFPDEEPLTRLVFELLLAIPSVPHLISNVAIDASAVMVRRGEATVNAHGFDISACSGPRGRALLAPT